MSATRWRAKCWRGLADGTWEQISVSLSAKNGQILTNQDNKYEKKMVEGYITGAAT